MQKDEGGQRFSGWMVGNVQVVVTGIGGQPEQASVGQPHDRAQLAKIRVRFHLTVEVEGRCGNPPGLFPRQIRVRVRHQQKAQVYLFNFGNEIGRAIATETAKGQASPYPGLGIEQQPEGKRGNQEGVAAVKGEEHQGNR